MRARGRDTDGRVATVWHSGLDFHVETSQLLKAVTCQNVDNARRFHQDIMHHVRTRADGP
jgi:hypothetical protein